MYSLGVVTQLPEDQQSDSDLWPIDDVPIDTSWPPGSDPADPPVVSSQDPPYRLPPIEVTAKRFPWAAIAGIALLAGMMMTGTTRQRQRSWL